MEKVNSNYSLKNIPVPSTSSYQLKLIDKIESVIKRMTEAATQRCSQEKVF